MKIKEAISRLSYTISKSNKPNETDALALNKIIDDLNAAAEKNLQSHVLFAKLYCVMLTKGSMHYGTMEQSNKHINIALKDPLEFHLQFLQQELQRQEIDQYFKSKGITDPLLHINNFEIYKHIFPKINVAEFKEVLDTWDEDNTKAHFELTVNQSILCFQKLK